MKQIAILPVSTLFVMFFLWFPLSAEELKIGYADEELHPFAMGNGSEQGDPPGIYIEILNRVASELNITLKYQRIPTLRGQMMLKKGELDGYFSLSYNEERRELGCYPMKNGSIDSSRRLGTLSYFFYTLENSSVEFDGKTVKNTSRPVGVNLGYSIIADIKNWGLQVEEAKTIDQNLKKLIIDRFDVFAGQDVGTDALIATGKYGNIKKLSIPIISKQYYLLFSNQFMLKNSDTAERIWTKIGTLRDKMTFDLGEKYEVSASD